MNNYLTVLIGHPRGGEKTWNSLYKYVLGPLNSELAILTGSKWLNNQSFLSIAKYKWIIEEPDDWFTYYEDNFQSKNWKTYFEKDKTTGLYNSGSIHFALKDILLKKHICELEAYKQIIITRFDQFYISNHKKFNDNSIWIPEGEDYFGVCDRHAVVPSSDIREFLNIAGYVNSNNTENYVSEFINCEVAYMHHLENSNLIDKVKRFKRFQFTTTIKEDFNRWRTPNYKIYFYHNIYLKYPDEFLDSVIGLSFIDTIKLILSTKFSIYLTYIYLNIRRKLGFLKKNLVILKLTSFFKFN